MWTEHTDGRALLVLRYEGETDGERVEKQVWLTEQGLQPVCAELYADGMRVLTLQVTAYQET